MVTLMVTIWFPIIVSEETPFFEPSPIQPGERSWVFCGAGIEPWATSPRTFE
jgi:hypothetical protein